MSGSGLIAIVRGVRPDEAVQIGQALHAEGFDAIEVPLNSPDPLESVRRLREALPADVPVGAGTVLDAASVQAARAAGAQFVVAPDTNPDVIRAASELGLASYPGAATVTEALAAARAGARAVKVFPADTVGVRAVEEWLTILPAGLEVIPVGGVDESSLDEWVGIGATGAGIGSAVYRRGDAPERVRRRARVIRAAWLEALKAQASRSAVGSTAIPG